ncbi:MAG: biotin/lipoyl-binding protein, partial [Gammaproteobacteria bacterium]|nr:biotin/lipoyl-binding protein [Gammaproteobacteria bacterium]MBT3867211.1 biotin/lipoyl-binding protein [Gammaproteobacteria bacterium]MBT4379518.1 biotin/lipoyl-binding protein [Gammaproteobacteria bacterium]MBT5199669.1 biotin/lipoyl-binding protein [Gammaproteobacteria bacterium]MBT5445574.1 biotin/lipoyl-binding protein [Gammaproteobacteria bacterium]
MSDQEEIVVDTAGDDLAQAPTGDTETDRSVKKGLLAVVSLILLSLTWYLFADRFTPYTTQARLEGYIVGVAPQVSGVVQEIWVSNNQSVEIGQKLFQIDPTQYEIALAKANSDLESA